MEATGTSTWSVTSTLIHTMKKRQISLALLASGSHNGLAMPMSSYEQSVSDIRCCPHFLRVVPPFSVKTSLAFLFASMRCHWLVVAGLYGPAIVPLDEPRLSTAHRRRRRGGLTSETTFRGQYESFGNLARQLIEIDKGHAGLNGGMQSIANQHFSHGKEFNCSNR
jgi:hypothetical protein